MQIRLLHIGLTYAGQAFAEGAVLSAGDEGDIPLDLALARLAARTAERADVAELDSALAGLLATLEARANDLRPHLDALLSALEAAPDEVVGVAYERLVEAFSGLSDFRSRLGDLELRVFPRAFVEPAPNTDGAAAPPPVDDPPPPPPPADEPPAPPKPPKPTKAPKPAATGA